MRDTHTTNQNGGNGRSTFSRVSNQLGEKKKKNQQSRQNFEFPIATADKWRAGNLKIENKKLVIVVCRHQRSINKEVGNDFVFSWNWKKGKALATFTPSMNARVVCSVLCVCAHGLSACRKRKEKRFSLLLRRLPPPLHFFFSLVPRIIIIVCTDTRTISKIQFSKKEEETSLYPDRQMTSVSIQIFTRIFFPANDKKKKWERRPRWVNG